MRIALAVAAFVLLAGPAPAADLLYHQEPDGTAVAGSLQDLVNAISQGREVVLAYEAGGTTWQRPCSFASWDQRSNVVSCYINEVPDTGFDPNFGFRSFAQPFALEYHIYNTEGRNSAVKINPATGEVSAIAVSDTNRTVLWFARQ